MNIIKALLTLIFITPAFSVAADSFSDRLQNFFGLSSSVAVDQQLLDPDRAFVMSAVTTGPETIRVYWQIAEGYYLYHDKFSFAVVSDEVSIDTEAIEIPPGKLKQDPSFGSVEVNVGDVQVDVPLIRQGTAEMPVTLSVAYQGCKEDSICYPPIKKQVPLVLSMLSRTAEAATLQTVSNPQDSRVMSEQDAITQKLQDGGLLLNILAFFGFGLFLSLTPCVFPMIPILSGIIIGQGEKITSPQAFLLSLIFVLAMAIMYALLGVIAGSFQLNLQAASQNIWAITGFSLVFVALALSMFGFYELQLPAAIQTRLMSLSDNQQAGTLYGSAVMGAVSAIIVGPCVAPPLAGALLYISQTGNALFGGLALFFMGLGFGVPLLIIGSSAGSLLPRAGAWMDVIKRFFGVIMLGVAIWFMGRVLPGTIILMLTALLLIVSAIFMGALDRMETGRGWTRLWKGLGLGMLVYGIVLIIGAASGGQDIFKPLQGLVRAVAVQDQVPAELSFKTIKSVEDLNNELSEASTAGKAVMFYFYADWCIVCKEMERYTFPDPGVHTALKNVVLLKADVTSNDDNDVALIRKFELYGPPAIIFFNKNAEERKPYRLVGFVAADKFIAHIKEAINS
ncbi:MAG: protein-disulfide reductase DsbD [Gammaproteobacteria bacterium]|nr:protein-disulfide reductase DsbD [Gammaproteobacteria bacterium]